MALHLSHKTSTTPGKVPLPADLERGEIAVNLADRRVFTKDQSDAVVSLSGLRFEGATTPTVAAPTNPVPGDTYALSAEGIFDASWTGLAGTHCALRSLITWDGTAWQALGVNNLSDLADVDTSVRDAGGVLTVGALAGVTFLQPGKYHVSPTGGTGSGLILEIEVDATGAASTVTVENPGKDYTAGDNLVIPGGTLGSTSQPGAITVATVGPVAPLVSGGTGQLVNTPSGWVQGNSSVTALPVSNAPQPGDTVLIARGGQQMRLTFDALMDLVAETVKNGGLPPGQSRIRHLLIKIDTEAETVGDATFDASTSNANYIEWGDGTTTAPAVHTYATPGKYNVRFFRTVAGNTLIGADRAKVIELLECHDTAFGEPISGPNWKHLRVIRRKWQLDTMTLGGRNFTCKDLPALVEVEPLDQVLPGVGGGHMGGWGNGDSCWANCVKLENYPVLKIPNAFLRSEYMRNTGIRSLEHIVETRAWPADGFFRDCAYLEYVNDVKLMGDMVGRCASLFKDCKRLEVVKDLVIDNNTTDRLDQLFEGCVSLRTISMASTGSRLEATFSTMGDQPVRIEYKALKPLSNGGRWALGGTNCIEFTFDARGCNGTAFDFTSAGLPVFASSTIDTYNMYWDPGATLNTDHLGTWAISGSPAMNALTTVNAEFFANVKVTGDGVDFRASKLTAKSVENILVGLANGPSVNIPIHLNGSTNAGVATLSAAAIAARDTLVDPARGCTVLLNP